LTPLSDFFLDDLCEYIKLVDLGEKKEGWSKAMKLAFQKNDRSAQLLSWVKTKKLLIPLIKRLAYQNHIEHLDQD